MRIIGGVEIGTSKITVLVGEITSRSIAIIGKGECQSNGIVKGVVVDSVAASTAVHTALELAEKSAQMRIEEIFLAQTGMHLTGFETDAVVNVSSINGTVSSLDIENACRIATARQLPENRTIVHELRRPFRLDGDVHPSPLHAPGKRLEANYWIVHGDTNTVTNSIYIIRDYNLRVTDLILSSLASGMMVTTAEDRQGGVLVFDIGAGTTDYVLYRRGGPYLTGVVPVGGKHITNDLSMGLRLPQGQAETIKTRFGRGNLACRDKTDKIWLNGDLAIGDRQIPRQGIEQITSARVQEIFEIAKKKLGLDFTPELVPAGIVITGGSSKLEGVTDAAQKIFQVDARLGELPPDINHQLRAPGYATALGLLFTGGKATQERGPQKKKGFMDFIRRLK